MVCFRLGLLQRDDGSAGDVDGAMLGAFESCRVGFGDAVNGAGLGGGEGGTAGERVVLVDGLELGADQGALCGVPVWGLLECEGGCRAQEGEGGKAFDHGAVADVGGEADHGGGAFCSGLLVVLVGQAERVGAEQAGELAHVVDVQGDGAAVALADLARPVDRSGACCFDESVDVGLDVGQRFFEAGLGLGCAFGEVVPELGAKGVVECAVGVGGGEGGGHA